MLSDSKFSYSGAEGRVPPHPRKKRRYFPYRDVSVLMRDPFFSGPPRPLPSYPAEGKRVNSSSLMKIHDQFCFNNQIYPVHSSERIHFYTR